MCKHLRNEYTEHTLHFVSIVFQSLSLSLNASTFSFSTRHWLLPGIGFNKKKRWNVRIKFIGNETIDDEIDIIHAVNRRFYAVNSTMGLGLIVV